MTPLGHDVGVEIGAVVERVQQICVVRADIAADPTAIKVALRASTDLKAWLAAGDADLAARLARQVSFPEKTIADCTRSSLNDATKTKERADTLGSLPSFADALDQAAITEFRRRLALEVRSIQADVRAGRPEFVAVIDASQSNGAGGPVVDWGVPVCRPPA